MSRVIPNAEAGRKESPSLPPCNEHGVILERITWSEPAEEELVRKLKVMLEEHKADKIETINEETPNE
ncbi:MAG TPA: hypothetical protein VM639_00850 [Dongiaceae bacterium]|nr:hypothetical protein [Dongiaceae bacterium]